MSKNVPAPAMTKSDRDWQAESDARTLSEHHVIHSDPKRHAAAIKAAEKMAQEKAEEAAAMKKVAESHPHQGGKGGHSKDGMVILNSDVRKV